MQLVQPTRSYRPKAGRRAASLHLHGFAPAWPCSCWGLPGRLHCWRRRWSLAPPFHPYRQRRRYVSVALCGGLPHPGGCPAACSTECGLSSTRFPGPRSPDQPGDSHHTLPGQWSQYTNFRGVFVPQKNEEERMGEYPVEIFDLIG